MHGKNDQPGSSAMEECEVHKPCGAQDHSNEVTEKEIKSVSHYREKGKNIFERGRL